MVNAKTAGALAASVGAIAPALGADWYVSPNGRDTNAGSAKEPFATVQKAVDVAQPGDTVHVRSGTYRLAAPVEVRAKGKPDAWLTLRGVGRSRPVLDASAVRPTDLRDASYGGAITLRGAEYVRVVGLEVRDSYRAGIALLDKCRWIDIVGCRTDGSFAPGIGVWNPAWNVRIFGNEVVRANTQTLRVYGDRARECPHEAISMMGCDGFEIAFNRVHHCEKEGIDVKETSRNGIVHHNWTHDLPRQGLYVDAWFGLLENVAFFSNLSERNEWGLAISCEGAKAELRGIRIHHNILVDNRASGIYFGTWGGDGPRSEILIAHNTVLRNGRPQHWAGATGNFDLRSKNVRSMSVLNNIFASGGAYEMASAISPDQFGSLAIAIRRNAIGSRRAETSYPSPYNAVQMILGEDSIVGDPDLDPKTFRLNADSPLRRAGAPIPELNLRAGTDLGALAFGSPRLPTPPPTMPGFPAVRPDLSGWPAVLRP